VPARRPRLSPATLVGVAVALHAGSILAAGSADPTAPPVPAWAPTERPPAPGPGLLPVDTRSFVSTITGAGASGLGLGIGGRVGTTFANGVSLATSGTYQGWESGRLASIGSALYGGAEFGYDFNLRYLVLRPYFAVGMALTTSGTTADAELAVWGGLQAVYDIPKSRLFVTLDLRAVSTASEEDLTVAGFAGFGVKFGS